MIYNAKDILFEKIFHKKKWQNKSAKILFLEHKGRLRVTPRSSISHALVSITTRACRRLTWYVMISTLQRVKISKKFSLGNFKSFEESHVLENTVSSLEIKESEISTAKRTQRLSVSGCTNRRDIAT